MANRYLSNLRSNASDGYYDTVATMIAADSQTRSAAIQGRYNALSNSITVMADSVVKGMTAAANYQLEQEKLITERRKAESSIARDQALIQIDEQRAETERIKVGMELDRVRRANRDLELERAAAPIIMEINKNSAALIGDISQAEDYQSARKKNEELVTKAQEILARHESGDPANGIVATPGITAAVMRNAGVLQTFNSAQQLVNSKGSMRYKDPISGQELTSKRADEVLGGDTATLEHGLIAFRSVMADVNATDSDRKKANEWKAKRLGSNDPNTRMEVTIEDWRYNSPASFGEFTKLLGQGRSRTTAFVTASKLKEVNDRSARAAVGLPPAERTAGIDAGAGSGATDAVTILEEVSGTKSPVAASAERADSLWRNEKALPRSKAIAKASFSGSADAIGRSTIVYSPGTTIGKIIGRPFISGDKNLQAAMVRETRTEVEKRAATALNGSDAQDWNRLAEAVEGTDKYKPGTATMRAWYDRVFKDIPLSGSRDKAAMMSQFADENIRLLPEGYDPALHLPLGSLGAAGKEIAKFSFADEQGVDEYKTVLGYVIAQKKKDPTLSVSKILTKASNKGILVPYSGIEPEASDGAAPATPAAASATVSTTPPPALGSGRTQ